MEGPKAHHHLLICFAFLEEPAGFVLTHRRRGNDSEFLSCSHPWLLETLSCAMQPRSPQGTSTPPCFDGMGFCTQVALSQLHRA